MNRHSPARWFGCVLAAATLCWSQASLAACSLDELLFLYNVGSFSYSVDTSGQFRLGATRITYSIGATTWITACNASGDPGSAAAVAGASKQAYLSLRAYRSLVDPEDRGVEVARTGMLSLHVWDPAPTAPPPAGEWVGYGGNYASPALQPRQVLTDGIYYVTMYLVEGTTGVAKVFQDFAQPLVIGTPPAVSSNYEGLWWKSPAESESGWGINLAHQGDVIFATWFTYDLAGKAWWLTMTANKIAEGVYAGTLLQTRGPAFNAVPFLPSAVTATSVGTGTLTFTDGNTGTFAYTVNGVSQTKAITRQVFGPLPTCVWGAQPNLTLATNFQDIWYAAPAESESGWGVNFTHQGDNIFATWFTYASDGAPLWLVATAAKTAPGVYSGSLLQTKGPAFNAVPFLPANVTATPVGTLTITFANGNSATYAYTVTLPGQSSVTQTKSVIRQVFRAPGTVCQ